MIFRTFRDSLSHPHLIKKITRAQAIHNYIINRTIYKQGKAIEIEATK